MTVTVVEPTKAEATAAMAAKRAIAERVLVQDMAELAAPHGFKISRHQVTVDHEREETRLTIQLVKGDGNQGVLKLGAGGKNGQEDES